MPERDQLLNEIDAVLAPSARLALIRPERKTPAARAQVSRDPLLAEMDEALGPAVQPSMRPASPRAGLFDRARDVAVSTLRGFARIPQAAIGLADIPTMGRAGKVIEETTGYAPGKDIELMGRFYSPAQQQAFERVERAEGVIGKAAAALSNPSTIAHAVLESAPLMLAGGGVARGVLAAAPKVAPLVAGALGEGAVGAGVAAEDIRTSTPEGTLTPAQSALALGSGVGTAGLGVLGGRIAQRLGIVDVETMLAGAASSPQARHNLVRAIYGAASEGFLEELPQSVQEQVLQNVALGRPLTADVDHAAVMGTLAGAATGGPVQAVAAGQRPRSAEAAPRPSPTQAARDPLLAEIDSVLTERPEMAPPPAPAVAPVSPAGRTFGLPQEMAGPVSPQAPAPLGAAPAPAAAALTADQVARNVQMRAEQEAEAAARPLRTDLTAMQQAREMERRLREGVSPTGQERRTGVDRRVTAGVSPTGVERRQYEYGSTQVNLPPAIGAQVQQLAAAIPDSELAARGREEEAHITVKYGIKGNQADQLRALLANEPPITVTLGKTSIFSAKKSGTDDVVKIDVDSADLHRINEKIAEALPTAETFPDYKPHVTLAYVRPGKGQQYAGNAALEGQTVTLDRLVFSAKDGTRTEIPLTGKPKLERLKEPPQEQAQAALPAPVRVMLRGPLGYTTAQIDALDAEEAIRLARGNISAKQREVSSALETRVEPEGRVGQYPGVAVERSPTAPGRGDRPLAGPPPPVTEAPAYVREGGEGVLAQEQTYAADNQIPDYLDRQPSDLVSRVQAVPLRLLEPSETTVSERSIEEMVAAMQAGDQLPAIVAEFSGETEAGEDTLTVIDGHHRLAAAQRFGYTTVPVRVRVSADDWAQVKAAGGLAIRGAVAEVGVAATPKAVKFGEAALETLNRVEQAARDRINERGTFKGTSLKAGLPVDDITDLVIIGAAKIAKGTVQFAQWSQAMIAEFGERIRPELQRVYQQAVTRASTVAEVDPDEYFNFRRVNVSEAEKDALRAEVIETTLRTGRLPKEKTTFAEIREDARNLHPDMLKHLAPFQEAQAPFRAVRMATRQRINALNRELVEARKHVAGLPEEEQLVKEAALQKKEADLRGLLDTWMRIRSEDGRNLAMHRMMADSTWETGRGFDHAYWLVRAKRSLGLPAGVDLPLNVHQKLNEILAKGDDAAKTGQSAVAVQQELAAFMQSLDKTGWLEAVALIRKAGLLTGIKTQLRNIGGSATFQVLEEVSRLPAVVVDLAISLGTGQRTVQGISPAAMARSSYQAATKGLKDAAEVLKTGSTADELMKVGARREMNTGIRWLDTYVNTVFRVMGAEDRVFKSYAFRRSLEEQAALQAINTGTSGIEILAHPDELMVAQAIADAEFATFNNPNVLGKAVRTTQATLQRQGPAGQWTAFAIDIAVPFANTPANIVSRMIDYTPIGGGIRASHAASQALVNRAMTPAQQRAFAQAIGRGMTGSALLWLGWSLAAAGLATGIGGDDRADAAVQQAAGRLPGAVRWGGRWHQVAPFSPLGNIVTIGASLHRAATRPLREEAARVGKVVGIASRVVLEQPMLQGLSDLVSALENPESRGEQVLTSTIGSFVPTFLNDAAALFDPYRRDVRPEGLRESLWMGAQSRLPGLRNLLPERRDIFGETARQELRPIWDPTIAPVARELHDDTLRALIAHDVGIGWPSRKPKESAEDYRRRTELVGRAIGRQVGIVVQAPWYRTASHETQTEALERAVDIARRQVAPIYPVTPERLAAYKGTLPPPQDTRSPVATSAR